MIAPADLVTLSKAIPMLLPVLRASNLPQLAAALDAHFDAANRALSLLTGQPVDVLAALGDDAWLDLLSQALDANSSDLERMAALAALSTANTSHA